MGMRSLYYHHSPGRFFAFATEPRAILVLPQTPYRINEARIADYLVGDARGHRQDEHLLRGGLPPAAGTHDDRHAGRDATAAVLGAGAGARASPALGRGVRRGVSRGVHRGGAVPAAHRRPVGFDAQRRHGLGLGRGGGEPAARGREPRAVAHVLGGIAGRRRRHRDARHPRRLDDGRSRPHDRELRRAGRPAARPGAAHCGRWRSPSTAT